MQREVLFEIKGLYRDDFRVTGFSFGEGEPSLCVIGSMRGNENQQLYCSSLLVNRLMELEQQGRIAKDKKILVIPCANPYSINIKKRFWSVDNTDINRMFPGYDLGETTQRIAAGVFEAVSQYEFGVQFASFYMPGAFVPHIRIMKTGCDYVELAKQFGLPYVVLQTPRPFDTATLNYNWQLWKTKAFSLYTTNTARVDKESAVQAVEAILNFMSKNAMIRYYGYNGFVSEVIDNRDFVAVRSNTAGFFESYVKVGEKVRQGQILAEISDTYLGGTIRRISAPIDGTIGFLSDEPMTYEDTAVLKIIRNKNV